MVLAFTGDGVHQHGTLDVHAAEQPDALDHPGGDPEGVALLVDLKFRGREHHGGVPEAQVAHDVPIQRLGEGVFHPLAQPGDGGLLGDHVHHHIGGQAIAPVGEPLDQIGVGDGGHPDGPALVVDLGGVAGVFKLADHVAEGAHLAVAQKLGGGAVQGGDLVEGDLCHVGGEVSGLDGEQFPVGGGPEDGHGDDLSHDGHHNDGGKENQYGQAALFDKPEPVPQLLLGGAHYVVVRRLGRQDKDADGVYNAQQGQEAVEVSRLGVDGGQGHVEIHKAHHSRNQQADQQTAGPAQGLAFLLFFQNKFLLFSKIRGGREILLLRIHAFPEKSNEQKIKF